MWCISHGQIVFSPVFDLYENHGYIITFSTFRSSVFTNGRFLFLTCYCAKCGSKFNVYLLCFFYKSEKHVFNVFYLQINVFNIYGQNYTNGGVVPEAGSRKSMCRCVAAAGRSWWPDVELRVSEVLDDVCVDDAGQVVVMVAAVEVEVVVVVVVEQVGKKKSSELTAKWRRSAANCRDCASTSTPSWCWRLTSRCHDDAASSNNCAICLTDVIFCRWLPWSAAAESEYGLVDNATLPELVTPPVARENADLQLGTRGLAPAGFMVTPGLLPALRDMVVDGRTRVTLLLADRCSFVSSAGVELIAGAMTTGCMSVSTGAVCSGTTGRRRRHHAPPPSAATPSAIHDSSSTELSVGPFHRPRPNPTQPVGQNNPWTTLRQQQQQQQRHTTHSSRETVMSGSSLRLSLVFGQWESVKKSNICRNIRKCLPLHFYARQQNVSRLLAIV